MADFAFIYGGGEGKDDFMDRARSLFNSLKVPVTLVDQQKLGTLLVGTLNEAVKYLTGTVIAPPPVGTFCLGTHSSTFFTRMPMYREQVAKKKKDNQDTTFEVLQKTITQPDGTPADADHTIAMPASVTGTPPPKCRVIVMGCNIGKGAPFVIKWAEALGPNVQVIAPLHFDELSKEDGYGLWESLGYQFAVFSPTKFKTAKDRRDAFVAKAKAGKFGLFADGAQVPDGVFNDEHWYQPSVNLEKRPTSTSMSLDVNVGKKKNIRVLRGLWVRKQKHQVPVFYETAADLPDPKNFNNLKTPADEENFNNFCKASIKDRLPKAYPRFKPRLDPQGTPFPDFERWGYDNVADFVDGWTWRFKQMPPQGTHQFVLGCAGERWAYTIIMPVTDPNPTVDKKVGKVRTNFFPKKGFKKVPLPDPLPVGLDLSNGNLFLTV